MTIELAATDVVHGIYIDGYGLSLEADPGKTERMIFTADRPGSFRFRCSVTCGSLHPFMIGKLQVGENSLLWRRRPGAVGAGRRPMVGEEVNQVGAKPSVNSSNRSWDGLTWPFPWSGACCSAAGRSSWSPAWPWAGSSWRSSPACSAHRWAAAIFGIIFVWIVWWALLMLVAVPLFGRLVQHLPYPRPRRMAAAPAR